MNPANVTLNGLTRLTEGPESRGGVRENFPSNRGMIHRASAFRKKIWLFACLVAVTAELYHS